MGNAHVFDFISQVFFDAVYEILKFLLGFFLLLLLVLIFQFPEIQLASGNILKLFTIEFR